MVNQITSHLSHYMDLLSARQKLVASNIANADTPGYKTRDIDFQFEYMSALDNPDGATADVVEVRDLAARNDGNNVSLDRESRLLSENAIRFEVATSMMKSQLQAIRMAIQEGKNG